MPAPASVQAALGDTIDRIAAASTQQLRLQVLQDDDLLIIEEPVHFAYRGDHGFALPPTKFLGLTLTASILTAIEFAPQTDYAGLADAVALADQVMRLATRAGWAPDANQAGIVGTNELRVLAGDNGRPVKAAWHVGRLSVGTTMLLLRLRRLHPDAYLLNLVWGDEVLFERARAIVLQLREVDGAPRDIMRTIGPAYPARARELLQRRPG